jgi:hypothetical protein
MFGQTLQQRRVHAGLSRAEAAPTGRFFPFGPGQLSPAASMMEANPPPR